MNLDKLYHLVQKIKKKPEVFLGKKSLHLLRAYLDGYIDYHNEKNNEFNRFFLPKFQDYVEQRYNISKSHSWVSLITFYSNSEEEAFDNFYLILDEFFSEM